MENGFIYTYAQRAGTPGFPFCLEHAQMAWNSNKTANQEMKEVHVAWLDLANAHMVQFPIHEVIYQSFLGSSMFHEIL